MRIEQQIPLDDVATVYFTVVLWIQTLVRMSLGVLQPCKGSSRGSHCRQSLEQESFGLMSRDSG